MVLLFRIENSLKALSKFTAVLGLLPLGLEGHGLGIEPVWKNLHNITWKVPSGGRRFYSQSISMILGDPAKGAGPSAPAKEYGIA